MNPSKVRMLREDDRAFEMHDGTSPFKVPKKGLSKSLEDQIRSMSAVDAPSSVDVAVGLPTEMSRLSPMEPQPIELARPPPVSPIPLGMSPEEKPYFPPEPAPLASAPAPGFDEAAYQAALQGKFPAGGPQQYLETKQRAGEVDKTLADRAAAADLGIRPPGTAPVLPTPEVPPPPAPAAPAPRVAAALPGLASMKSGVGQQQAANMAAGEVKAEEGRQTADALAGFQRQLEASALEDKVRRTAADARAAEVMTQFKNAQEEMKNIDTTVDPGRYWASRGTAGKISGIIGLALGALGTGPDGVNRAAAMLDKAIDRDLEAQKAEHSLRLQKGKSGLDAAQSAYAMEHTRFGDEAAGSAAAKANLLGLAQNKLAQITAGSANPAAKAQAAALNGALELEKGKLEQDAANALATRTQHYAAAEAARAKPTTPGGAAAANTLTEVKERAANLRTNIAAADALISKSGTFELVGGDQQELNRLLTDIAIDSAKLKDPTSVARESEVANETRSLGVEAGSLLTSNATAKKLLKSFAAGVDRREDEALRVRGLPVPERKKEK